MFTEEQKTVIYKYFPQVTDDGYERCEICYINPLDKWEQFSSDYNYNCYVCSNYNLSEDTIKTNILVKSYTKHGLMALQELIHTLDPKNEIKNIYDKALLRVLDKPQKIKELLDVGANPDMDYGEVTGKTEYTLLQWCLQENNEIAILLLTRASTTGEIFRKRNRYNRTPMGEQISLMLRSETRDEYSKEMIRILIKLGVDPSSENLNTLGISGIQYEEKPYRQNNIKWLLDIGVKYDLEKCIVFGCTSKGGTKERCGCKSKRLKETRLGKFLNDIKNI
jgi:hypothetical protein